MKPIEKTSWKCLPALKWGINPSEAWARDEKHKYKTMGCQLILLSPGATGPWKKPLRPFPSIKRARQPAMKSHRTVWPIAALNPGHRFSVMWHCAESLAVPAVPYGLDSAFCGNSRDSPISFPRSWLGSSPWAELQQNHLFHCRQRTFWRWRWISRACQGEWDTRGLLVGFSLKVVTPSGCLK